MRDAPAGSIQPSVTPQAPFFAPQSGIQLWSPWDMARAAPAWGVMRGWGCSSHPHTQSWGPPGLKHPPQGSAALLWVLMVELGGPKQQDPQHPLSSLEMEQEQAPCQLPQAKGSGVEEPQEGVSAPRHGVRASPWVPAGGAGVTGRRPKAGSPSGSACDRSSPCTLLHHHPAAPQHAKWVEQPSPPTQQKGDEPQLGAQELHFNKYIYRAAEITEKRCKEKLCPAPQQPPPAH